MAKIMDDIAYLSQEIGPRPAGTEEEQQAALYVADQIQKRTGFSATIEDFAAAVQPGIVEALCFGIPALVSLLAIIINVLALPAFFIALAGALLYAFELMDRPLLSRVFERGVSQNVVARYTPGTQASQRNRKIVLVANYDSSKVQSELSGGLFSVYPTLVKASAIALVALPVLWLFRMLLPAGAGAFFNILIAIALVLALVPVAVFLMHKTATYNEAANNNASGVATLIEVARLISDGSYSEEDLAAQEEAQIHGAQAAYDAGVVPEGAELEYAVEENMTEEQRLASAKAAVAALTGRPVTERHIEHIDFTPLAMREDIDSYVEMDYGEYGYQESEDEEPLGELPPVFNALDGAFDEQETAILETVPAEAAEEAPTQMPEAPAPAAPEAAIPEVAVPVVPAASATAGAPAAADVSPVQAQAYAPETRAPQTLSELVAAAERAPELNLPEVNPNEPSWYTTGKAKALKAVGVIDTPVRRSRYADALDAAVAASKKHIDEAARLLDEGTIERISEMQQQIGGKVSVDDSPSSAPLQVLFAERDKEAAEEAEATEELKATDAQQPEEVVDAPEATEDVQQAESVAVQPEPTEEETEEETETTATENTTATIEESAASEAEEQEERTSDPGATTAMPPIDVSKLRTHQTPSAPAANAGAPQSGSEEHIHDFSKVEPPASSRFRNIVLPTFDTPEQASSAPARHRTPTMVSEAIPRVVPKADQKLESVFITDEEIAQAQTVQAQTTESKAQTAAAEEKASASSVQQQNTPERPAEDRRAALRNLIPSLSGEFSPIVVSEDEAEEGNTEVSKTGSFATLGSDAAINPVGDELVADLKPEDRYVEDADDSSYEENTTETGAFAGPGYVEMPESRISRFFNRFRSKKETDETEETSASEWLDVDENFNPTEVGAARGGWESFRSSEESTQDEATAKEVVQDELPELFEDEYGQDFESESDERPWNGGAFSQLRAKLLGDPSTSEAAQELANAAEAPAEDDFDEYDDYDEYEDDPSEENSAPEDAAGEEVEEALSENEDEKVWADSKKPKEAKAQEEASSALSSEHIAEETKLIYSFRNPDINTDVWFVALGSEYAGNGGMKAFLAEHADELRGAIIINMEAMGAGNLSFVEEEGLLLTRKPSSRLKRFLRKATEITGVGTATARIGWRESAASLALKRGMQAMTLAGFENGKPAYLGQGDDVLENIDETMIEENARFILEIIKNI